MQRASSVPDKPFNSTSWLATLFHCWQPPPQGMTVIHLLAISFVHKKILLKTHGVIRSLHPRISKASFQRWGKIISSYVDVICHLYKSSISIRISCHTVLGKFGFTQLQKHVEKSPLENMHAEKPKGCVHLAARSTLTHLSFKYLNIWIFQDALQINSKYSHITRIVTQL